MTIQSQVVDFRPRIDVVQLIGTRMDVAGWYNQVCVVSILGDPVAGSGCSKVGRVDDI